MYGPPATASAVSHLPPGARSAEGHNRGVSFMSFHQSLRSLVLAAAVAGASLCGAKADEISVTQWGTSLYGAPYAVAMADGLFKKAGVDITSIIGSGGGGTTVRNLLASDTPYGEVAIAAALAAQRQGLDVVIVNTGTRSVAEASLVTMPDSSVKSLKDLEGKKVAITSPKGVSEMLLLMALKEQGVDASKVERVASGGYVNGLTMLEQGAVAAAVLIEPLSIIRADKYRTVVNYGKVLAPMTTSVGITTRAFAKANPAKLKAIIAGRAAGVEALYADPAKAATIIAKDFKLDPPIAKIAVENMIAPRMWSLGEFSIPELNRTVDGLKLIGEVTADVDWSKLLDPSYLPPALQAVK
ncbi:ABC transporter substrate-binding protein [Azorhizobium doebereinerae]|uniref:ABC transporter substrate-binding protein n=1 Tax=Azorhizobium doebereinerae TaxID=281091 RepID=UPI00042789F4|nr:ABC transporter substrate-binding protein [Azorhizobium doebereinerae]